MSNYLFTYNYFYNKTFNISEKFLKTYLKKNAPNSVNYTYVLNTSLDKMNSSITIITEYLNSNFPNSFKLFNKRSEFYSENEVQLILENKVLKAFLEEQKIVNNFNYTFSHFIGDIANLNSLNNSRSIFYNNTPLFEKMFELNKFQDFKLVPYKKDAKLLKLEEEFSSRLYPKMAARNQREPFFDKIYPNNLENDAISEVAENKIEVIAEPTINGTPIKITENETFIDIIQLSELLMLAKQTIYGMVHEDKIPYHKRGKKLYFIKDDIIEWVKSGRKKKLSASEKVDKLLSKKENHK